MSKNSTNPQTAREETATFLAEFPGRQTFQTFDDKGKSGSLARILHDQTLLQGLNDAGAGIFMMINEGDGQGRANENVLRIRAYFADFDGGALPASWALTPSLLVESSAGRFHAYWLLLDAPILDNAAFNAQQEAIAVAVGAEPNDCKGLARVMRLPGYKHQKAGAVPTRILNVSGERYTAAQVAAAYPVPVAVANKVTLGRYVAPVGAADGAPSPEKILEVLLANTDLNVGRNNTAFKLACQVRDNGHPLSAARAIMDEFASRAGEGFTLSEALHAAEMAYRQTPREPWQSRAISAGMYVRHTGGSATQTVDEDGQTVDEDGVVQKTARQYTLTRKDGRPTLTQMRDVFLDEAALHGKVYKFHQISRVWHIYGPGVYLPITDVEMMQAVNNILEEKGEEDLAQNKLSDVVHKVSYVPSIARNKEDLGGYQLNVTNGLLDMNSGELIEHSPEFFSTIQSAAAYRPNAVAYDWQDFLDLAVPNVADQRLLQQYAGLCLTADTSPQKALILIGDGGTGKGTFASVIEAVLGSLSIARDLSVMSSGSFMLAEVVGKRLCVVSEMDAKSDMKAFKRIVGEDRMGIDVKNKDPFTAKLDVKMLILSNVMPHMGEDTSNTSITRRLMGVEFNVKPTVPDVGLRSRLTQPEELSGILNWMLEGLHQLRANNMAFSENPHSPFAQQLIENSNKVIEFLREECRPYAAGKVSQTTVYERYVDWCHRMGYKPLNSGNMAKQVVSGAAYLGHEVKQHRTKQGNDMLGMLVGTSSAGW